MQYRVTVRSIMIEVKIFVDSSSSRDDFPILSFVITAAAVCLSGLFCRRRLSRASTQ